jgi:xylan 1,4-beta-xylosidase
MKRTAFILFFFVSLSSWAQNLISNPGFESGTTNWGLYTNGPSFITTQIDNTVAHSGNNSMRIIVNHDTVAQTGVVYQIMKLKKGGHYLFDAFIKTDSVVNGGAVQYIILYLNGQRLYGEGGFTFDGTTSGWKETDFRFYMPQNSDTLQLMIALGATNGTAWFDDLSLTELTDTAYNQFSVDLTSPTGSNVNPFTSVNVGPTDPTVSTLNLTPQFQQLGVEYVRTHDYEGPCDMHVIFPDTSRSAIDSTAYDFSLTDSVITACVKAGCKIYYRLGESGSNNKSLYNPPYDYNKWAQVALHIMKHFNQGWDKGFHYSIKYWEIFNEPDLGWNGTVNQFIKLYRLTSLDLKTADTSLRIGGPAIAGLTSTDFLYTFLDSVSKEKLPFDFFSYHYYHTFNPYDFVRYDEQAKQILTTYGLGKAPRIVSEWNNYNYNPGNNYFVWRDDPYIAASTIASLIYYQNTDVFKLLRYRIDGTDLGMFDANGNYTFSGFGYYFMSNFRNAPKRLLTKGGDTLGTSILAGQALNDSLTAVMIADNCSSANGYTLSVNDISATDQDNYYIYRIDSNIISKPVDSGAVTLTNNKINVQVKPPYVDFVLLFRKAYTGINSVSAGGSINVFPNPFTSNVIIQYNIDGEVVERIFVNDMLGRTVKSFTPEECLKGNKLEWNGCNNFGEPVPSGIYVIRVLSSKGVYEVKLIHIK